MLKDILCFELSDTLSYKILEFLNKLNNQEPHKLVWKIL